MVACTVQVLEQPLKMLRDGIVGDRELAHESSLIPGSTPGKHLRQYVSRSSICASACDAYDGALDW